MAGERVGFGGAPQPAATKSQAAPPMRTGEAIMDPQRPPPQMGMGSPQAVQAAQLVRSLRGRVGGQPGMPQTAQPMMPPQGAKSQQMPNAQGGQMIPGTNMRFPTVRKPQGSATSKGIADYMAQNQAALLAAQKQAADLQGQLDAYYRTNSGGGTAAGDSTGTSGPGDGGPL